MNSSASVTDSICFMGVVPNGDAPLLSGSALIALDRPFKICFGKGMTVVGFFFFVPPPVSDDDDDDESSCKVCCCFFVNG